MTNSRAETANTRAETGKHLRQPGDHLRRRREHLRRRGEHLRRRGEYLRRCGEYLRQRGEHLRLRGKHLRRPTGHLRLSPSSARGYAAVGVLASVANSYSRTRSLRGMSNRLFSSGVMISPCQDRAGRAGSVSCSGTSSPSIPRNTVETASGSAWLSWRTYTRGRLHVRYGCKSAGRRCSRPWAWMNSTVPRLVGSPQLTHSVRFPCWSRLRERVRSQTPRIQLDVVSAADLSFTDNSSIIRKSSSQPKIQRSSWGRRRRY